MIGVTWMSTALAVAVALAVAAALCFASAAFLQQRAVAEVTELGRADGSARAGISAGSFRSLARQQRWLAGWGLLAAGTLLHLSALLLAPVAVVQPIGILAVPAAVLLAARTTGRHPSGLVLSGVALSIFGTGTFVVVTTTRVTSTPSPPTASGVITGLVLLAAVVAVLAMLTTRLNGVGRGLAFATMGAATYGCASALIRVISRTVAVEPANLVSPLVATATLAVGAALALGAWSVQQAYASGAAAVVLSVLNVGDPLVAILLSAGLFGEGFDPDVVAVVAVLAMITSAGAAACGVGVLARHYPVAVPDVPSGTARVLATVG